VFWTKRRKKKDGCNLPTESLEILITACKKVHEKEQQRELSGGKNKGKGFFNLGIYHS